MFLFLKIRSPTRMVTGPLDLGHQGVPSPGRKHSRELAETHWPPSAGGPGFLCFPAVAGAAVGTHSSNSLLTFQAKSGQETDEPLKTRRTQ